MATTVSLVQYKTSPRKMSNSDRRDVIILKPEHKSLTITANNVLTESKCVNNNQEDVGGLISNTTDRKSIMNPAGTKMTVIREGATVQPHQRQPMAVARRNARERNRVKQVNNGFATLRQHIPNCIASAFETHNGRSGNKKLSKVETLRMAVEYIRSLEELLAGETSSAPLLANQYCASTVSDSTTDDLESFSPPPTIPPLSTTTAAQFIRLGAYGRTYQIVQSRLYDDNENVAPITTTDHHLLAIRGDPTGIIAEDDGMLHFSGVVQDLSLLHQIQQQQQQLSNESLSTDTITYTSDSSLSPPMPHGVFVTTFKDEIVEPENLEQAVSDETQWWQQQQENLSNVHTIS